MEHSLQPPRLVGSWRTATIVATGIAALELMALVAAGSALLMKPAAQRAREATPAARAPKAKAAAPRKRAPVRAARPLLPRARTSILVLNGNGITGAAAAKAARVRALGYRVGGVGNAPRRDSTRTLVMYRPGARREGVRLARDLHVSIVSPLDGLRTSELAGARLALVVGL